MAARLPEQQVARLQGHKGAVHALTYSSGTGQYVLSGSSDRTINLWNPAKATSADAKQAQGALIQSYTGAHGYEVLALAVSQDNSRFVSGGGDKSVFLWDVSTAQTIRRYGGGLGSHTGRIECVAFGGDRDAIVLSGSFDSTVRLWDTKSHDYRPLLVLGDAKDSVSSLVVAGHEIMAGSIDGRVRVYDVRMGMVNVDVIGPSVTSLTATVQTDALLVSSLDSTIRLVDKADGRLLQSFKDAKFTNEAYRLRSTLAAKDALVVSGGEDGSIFAWDVLSGQCVQRLCHDAAEARATGSSRSSRRAVSAVACRRGSTEWASAGGDGTIIIWGAIL